MAKFPMDLSKFKKIASDQNTTTLRHPQGHEMKIAHGALSPKMREQLHALPMAEGGAVDDVPEPNKKNAADVSKGATESGWGAFKQGVQNLVGSSTPTPKPTAQYADGTPDAPVSADDQQQATPAVAAPQQAPVVINVGAPAPAQSNAQAQQAAYQNAFPGSSIMDAPPQGAPIPSDARGYAEAVAANAMAGRQPPATAQQQSAPIQDQRLPAADDGKVPATTNPQAQASSEDPDPYGLGAQQKTYMQGLNQFQQGVNQQTQGVAGESAEKVASYQDPQTGIDAKQQTLQDFQDSKATADDHYQQAFDAYKNQKVDFNRYVSNMSTGKHILSALGLIIGSAGAAGAHQQNIAAGLLDSAINRDVEQQKAEMGQKDNLLKASMEHYHNLHDATAMVYALQNGIAADKLNMAAARASSPIVAGQLQQLAGQKQMEAADHIRAIAMNQTLMKSVQQSNGAGTADHGTEAIERQINAMRIIAPERAKEIESRFVPGVGLAAVPLSESVRSQITERKILQDNIEKLSQWSATHAGTLDPKQIAYGRGLASQVQDQYRRANQQGVFKPAEAAFVNGVIGDNPDSFLAKWTKQPGYKAAAMVNAGNLNALYSSVGIKPVQNRSASSNTGFVPKTFKKQ